MKELKIGSIYGVYDDAAGVEMRGRFIIDPDGVVKAIEILTPPVGRNVSELIRLNTLGTCIPSKNLPKKKSQLCTGQ